MAITLPLPPETQAEIERLVRSGDFTSPEDVVVKAIASLVEKQREARFWSTLQEATEGLDRGNGVDVNPGFYERILREARLKRGAGIAPDPNPEAWPTDDAS